MQRPTAPVPVIVPKFPGQPLGFDTLGYHRLRQHGSLRLNENVLLLSTIAWAFNCDTPTLCHIVTTARRTILYGLREKVAETEAIAAECRHMTDVEIDAVRAQCIRPLEAKLGRLQEQMNELSRLRQSCERGTNAVVGRGTYADHLIPCAQHLFGGRVYSAWLDEIIDFSRATLA